jgi:hypothetical protein
MTGLSDSTISLAAVGFEVSSRQYMNPYAVSSDTGEERGDILDLEDLDYPLPPLPS